MKIAVLASGKGTNLQAIIDEWFEEALPVEFVGVGSDKVSAYALKRAEAAHIPTRVFPKENYANRQEQEEDILAWFEMLGVELLLLAGYMRVLSPEFIRRADFPIINIHPSLLPSFPGLNAQKQAVEYGAKVSGCTVHFVDEGMDTGPVIMQEAVQVFEEDSEEELAARILKVEHKIYPQVVRLMALEKITRKGRKVYIQRDS